MILWQLLKFANTKEGMDFAISGHVCLVSLRHDRVFTQSSTCDQEPDEFEANPVSAWMTELNKSLMAQVIAIRRKKHFDEL